MTAIRTWLTTVLFWSYLVSTLPLWWLVSLPVALISIVTDSQRKLLHTFSCVWGYHYIAWLPLWKVSWAGRHNIVDGEPYVLVANHQSLGDIIALYGLFKHFKWVSKSSIFKVPFIGWNMRANAYIPIVRGDRVSVVHMLELCRQHLQDGSSIMMFPEGTRSHDGRLKAFKPGAFALAQDLGIKVVPIVIDGTAEALPKSGFMLRNPWHMPIQISVLPPVEATQAKTPADLATAVQDAMATELARMRDVERTEVLASHR
ncbi:MAG: lysophospholipid acyltransferase family protein [Myxococcota bacterium]